MKAKTIKLTSAVEACGMSIPAGTVLKFNKAGNAIYRGHRIPASMFPGIESDCSAQGDEVAAEGADAVAETIIDMLRAKYPSGFTAAQLSEDFDDKINGAIYSLSDSEGDADAVLTLSIDDNTELKIYLAKDETDTFTLTGKYDSAAIEEATDMVAVESFIGRMALATRAKKACKRKAIVTFGKK